MEREPFEVCGTSNAKCHGTQRARRLMSANPCHFAPDEPREVEESDTGSLDDGSGGALRSRLAIIEVVGWRRGNRCCGRSRLSARLVRPTLPRSPGRTCGPSQPPVNTAGRRRSVHSLSGMALAQHSDQGLSATDTTACVGHGTVGHVGFALDRTVAGEALRAHSLLRRYANAVRRCEAPRALGVSPGV